LPAYQLTKQALYSIPAGFSVILPTIIVSFRKDAGPDTSVLMSTKIKPFDYTYWFKTIELDIIRGGNSSAQFGDEFPDGIIGPQDIKISAESGAANSEVTARFNGILVKTV
jgi:hypothetical protein